MFKRMLFLGLLLFGGLFSGTITRQVLANSPPVGRNVNTVIKALGVLENFVICPAYSTGYSYLIYTNPSLVDSVRITAKATWWSDWYSPPPYENTAAQPYLVEDGYKGGYNCDWIRSYPQNNYFYLNLSIPNQYDEKEGSIIIGPRRKAYIAGSDCYMPDDFRAHFYITWKVSTLKPLITFVDPYPDLMSNGKVIITDPEQLGSYAGRHVTGLTADGVTPVLIKAQVSESGTMEFSLRDEHGNSTDAGTLSTPGGSEGVTTLEVPVNELSDGRYMAFAVLTAPPAFFRGPGDEALLERPITIEANFAPSGCSNGYPDSCDVKLVRPYVIMMHGLWSDSSAFASLSAELYNNGFLYQSRHSYNNSASFATNDWVLPHLINNTLTNHRTAGYACTKVDIVAHSMGGLLAKRLDQSFAQKTVRKIITIGSPYQGSPLADLLINDILVNRPSLFWCIEKFVFNAIARNKHSLSGGAVSDLRCNGGVSVNAEIPGVDCSGIVVGIRDGSFDPSPDGLMLGLYLTALRAIRNQDNDENYYYLFGTEASDWIVSASSQRGNATGSQDILVLWHGTETHDMDFEELVINRLNAPAQQSQSIGSLIVEDDILSKTQGQGAPFVTKNTFSERLITQNAAEPIGTIEITTPAEGQTCKAGESITISVQGGGDTTKAAIFAFLGTYPWSDIVELPWEGEVNIPIDTVGSVGQTVAIGFDTNMNMTAVDEVNVILDSNIVLENIFFGFGDKWTFDFKTFPKQSHELQLYPMGVFSDGSEHPLSVLAEPTVYETADGNVATVDADGLITVHSRGITTITVTCSTKTAYLQIEVDALIEDLDLNGDVDFADYALFANYWMNEDCNEPDWCKHADFNESGCVNWYDLAVLAEHWLEGTTP